MFKSLSRALILAGLAGPLSDARAETCTYSVPDKGKSGDDFYLRSTDWCRQDWVDFFWNNYDFDAGDWDNGFGFPNACDTDQGLGRTFNAIFALHYSSPTPARRTDDMSGNILRSGGNFALRTIDELDAACGSTTGWAAATANFPNAYTNLYLAFFYKLPVVERAGTLVHESFHAAGIHHNAKGCAYGDHCDSDWDYFGPWKAEILWLWWFRVEGVNTTTAMKERARDVAQYEIEHTFVHPPNINIW